MGKGKKKHLLKLNGKYYKWFFCTELLVLSGVLFSQRTIDLCPAVSFVAVIESFQPAFIILISGLIYYTAKNCSLNTDKFERLHEEQLAGGRTKLIAIAIMAIGIYIINR